MLTSEMLLKLARDSSTSTVSGSPVQHVQYPLYLTSISTDMVNVI